MLEALNSLDLTILHFFNQTLASPQLDRFWLFVTQMHKSPVMLSVMASLLIWVVYIYRFDSLKLFLGLGLAIALADAIAYRGIKKNFERLRPFQNPEISESVRHVGTSHGPSFPSNHAANCFAAAVVLSWYFGRNRATFFGVAALVAISRVALGVHYPSDVLAGAILGFFVGWLVTQLMTKCMRDWNSRSISRR
jgi:undecaprenyl-diphosphatase